MAEETGDKTEAPTAKRRQQAAEQGQVARSPDLVAAALVVGSMLLLKSYGADLVTALKALLTEMLDRPSLSDLSTAGTTGAAFRAVGVIGKALTPLLVGVVIIAAVGNLLQVGLKF